jgi:dihydroorotase
MGQSGAQLTEFHALAEAGAVAFSDDGRPVVSSAVMRRALEYARDMGAPIIGHEEDPTLAEGGHMHEGAVATRLGIQGIPSEAESIMVRRDVELAALTGGRVHLAHLSCAGSYDALRDAKRRGLRVTGEVCPHHWTLTDEAVGEYDTMAKMNPPLRPAADRDAAIAAIADGTIDCLATDHAPHTAAEKDQPFDAAPFGIVGLETALGLTITHLVRPGHLTLATPSPSLRTASGFLRTHWFEIYVQTRLSPQRSKNTRTAKIQKESEGANHSAPTNTMTMIRNGRSSLRNSLRRTVE